MERTHNTETSCEGQAQRQMLDTRCLIIVKELDPPVKPGNDTGIADPPVKPGNDTGIADPPVKLVL